MVCCMCCSAIWLMHIFISIAIAIGLLLELSGRPSRDLGAGETPTEGLRGAGPHNEGHRSCRGAQGRPGCPGNLGAACTVTTATAAVGPSAGPGGALSWGGVGCIYNIYWHSYQLSGL